MRDHDMTFINLAMWEKRNNWTKRVFIQPSWDVDEKRMSAVFLEACSQPHKFCVHNTLDWLRLEPASSWLNVMWWLLTSANLSHCIRSQFQSRHQPSTFTPIPRWLCRTAPPGSSGAPSSRMRWWAALRRWPGASSRVSLTTSSPNLHTW